MLNEDETGIGLTLEPASDADLDAVLRLLSASELLVGDLETHLADFTLARRESASRWYRRLRRARRRAPSCWLELLSGSKAERDAL